LGKGRVACFLAMYRGHSKGNQLAYFDWVAWPAVLRAVITWLAPNAARTDPPP